MISPESRTIEWIRSVSRERRVKDIGLLEKTIRAFSLLESLSRSGCPFVFKGGSCLMLHFNTEKRLSIDIDIICPPGTEIDKYLETYAEEYGFQKPELLNRTSRFNIPKQHAKYNYQVSYTGGKSDYVLLDVLLEDTPYNHLEKKAIRSPFLITEGEDVFVDVPSMSDILGDKLAAFAPNTTGIPYFKKDKNGIDRDCAQEIAKQLFDVACLIDSLDNFENTFDVYKRNVAVELEYRGMTDKNFDDVLNDSRTTALCLGTSGAFEKDRFELLNTGFPKLTNFMYGSKKYRLEQAVVDSAKVAYLSACFQKGVFIPEKYAPNKVGRLINAEIDSSLDTDSVKWSKLNKLKKSNIEAFYYWFRTFELLKS